MTLRFRGGERLQRGRGIGGLLRLVKSVFSPLVKSAGKTVIKAVKSDSGKMLGNALKEQAISSAINLVGDVVKGNNIKESIQNEITSSRENLGDTIKSINPRNKKRKIEKISPKQRKVVSTKKRKKTVVANDLSGPFSVTTVTLPRYTCTTMFQFQFQCFSLLT